MTKLDMNCNSIEVALKKALIADGQPVRRIAVISWAAGIEGDLVNAKLYFVDRKVMEVSFFVYFDGTYFTPFDWKGFIPTSLDEVSDVDWQLGVSGKKAIVIGRAPRMLFGE